MKSHDERAAKYSIFFGFVVLIIGTLLIFQDSLFIPINNQGPNTATEPQEDNSQQLIEQVITSAPSLGNSNAQVVLIEFADFQCPFCKEVSPILDEIHSEYAGQVQRVWIHTINEAQHPQARSAAIASQCAHQQGQFWAFHDLLFENQAKLSQSVYPQLAQEIGLDLQQFNTCIASDSMSDLIDSHLQFARNANVTSTPTLSINNQTVEGVFTKNQLKQVIDSIL